MWIEKLEWEKMKGLLLLLLLVVGREGIVEATRAGKVIGTMQLQW